MANHEYILIHFSEDEKAILEPYLGKLDDLFEKHNNYKRTDEFFKNNLVGLTDFYADKLIKLYRDYYARVPIFESYFPEFCEEYPEYMAFLHSACVIFNELFNKVATFNYLVNADRVPASFINALANALGYEFKENVPVVYQRELLKRLLNIYKCRGSETDIILKGQQFDNEGYLGGRLFVPGTYKDGYAMSITFPREDLFIWSQSTRSTKYRYPNIDYYRDGLISFNTPIINDELKKAVCSVVPAGVTIVFTYTTEAPYPFNGAIAITSYVAPLVNTQHTKHFYFDNDIHTFDYNGVVQTFAGVTKITDYNCFDGEEHSCDGIQI